jgi:5-methylcytosine-specific restriction endonuclease McrA
MGGKYKSIEKKRASGLRNYYRHREELKPRIQKRNLKLRLGAIIVLGGKCTQCGYYKDDRALQIDHILPILLGRRRDEMRHSQQFHLDIINGERDNLQLLCANCHAIKSDSERRNVHAK